jgi:phospho-N-acetylmuramoyl-pentapeptide-transferase
LDSETIAFIGYLNNIAAISCALVTAALGYWAVPLLQALKMGQIIREDGPQTHLQKAGTPTMGGVFFVPVAVIVALVWSGSLLQDW